MSGAIHHWLLWLLLLLLLLLLRLRLVVMHVTSNNLSLEVLLHRFVDNAVVLDERRHGIVFGFVLTIGHGTFVRVRGWQIPGQVLEIQWHY